MRFKRRIFVLIFLDNHFAPPLKENSWLASTLPHLVSDVGRESVVNLTIPVVLFH